MAKSSLAGVIRRFGPVIPVLWIVGLLLLVVARAWEIYDWPVHHFVAPALSHLAVALIVGALMVSFDKVVFFDELREEVIRLVHLNRLVADSGLEAVVPKEERLFAGFGDLIRDSDRLSVVVNHGKDWVSNWRPLLADRLRDASKETDYYLIDPASRFVDQLAEKQSLDLPADVRTRSPEDLRQKIRDTERDLARLHQEAGGNGVLRIFYIPWPLFPTISIYLGERTSGPGRVAITLYTTSSIKGGVPLFMLTERPGHDSVFGQLQADVHRLRARLDPHLTLGPPPPPAA